MALKDELAVQWRTGGVLVRLILINVGVFLALRLVDLIFFLSGNQGPNVAQWLMSTSHLPTLLVRPWTVLTYMFAHWDLFHILFNMLMLWFAGRLFLDLLGPKRLVGNYLLGGFFGLALYVISYNLFPPFQRFAEGSTILGASAAVMGVFIGIAAYRPDMVVHMIIFGAVRLKWIALIYIVIDLISVRQGGNSGGHIAHLGGALYGYLAAVQLRRGRDWSLAFVSFWERTWDLLSGSRVRRLKVAHRKERVSVMADRIAEHKRDRQARVDTILDKISRSGYDSLSKEEKDFLFRASNDR
ncbi:MAG: rhomboid family intramembrane serine protease [Flavobacteriales bacterium]|nr:rhomboid family intramembrane serine protease [Flavobacteriales bacterium]